MQLEKRERESESERASERARERERERERDGQFFYCLQILMSLRLSFVLGVHEVIAQLVSILLAQKVLFPGPLDHVEYFAGDAAVTAGEREDRFQACLL